MQLVKDIITESASFDLVAFMPLLRERVYTKHNFARAFVVSWVSVMNSVPDIDMLIFLPEILDGLFYILEDPSVELKKMCETTLSEFLRNILQHPDRVDFAAMIRNLIVHSHSSEELVQYKAIRWMREFVALSGRTLLPHAAGILEAVLPTLSYDDPRCTEAIRETAKAVSMRLMHLVTEEDDQPLSRGPVVSDSDSPATRGLGLGVQQRIAGELQPEGVNAIAVPVATELELTPLVNVLTRQLMHVSMQTRIAVLRWFLHLFTKIPNKAVLLDLEVLAEISSSSAPGGGGALKRAINSDGSVPAGDAAAAPNCYFGKFMLSLLDLFQSDRQLLEDRGSFIISRVVNPEGMSDWALMETLRGHGDDRYSEVDSSRASVLRREFADC
ncbi:hypothetical protein HPB51_026438 [Rhipicephalus microplus]|uniref:Uncharacterized protein n=1 Tax=Rhipicephalus microplus TaxID=6941 RepID=A0A9J6D2X9_RHIMP|nr:hypothetical protein HPB51_026438 [Rhipicephalus microplus]